MPDKKAYYVIGYVPEPSSFSKDGTPVFHRIEVRVRRKGLTVRSRKGFFCVRDDDPRLSPSDSQTLAGAALSPFPANGINLRLSSLFVYDKARGAQLHSFLRVD